MWREFEEVSAALNPVAMVWRCPLLAVSSVPVTAAAGIGRVATFGSAKRREAPVATSSLLLLLLRLSSFLLACPCQHARKRVVPLVARVLVNHLVDAVERQLAAVRRGERRWVLHRELVEQDIPTRAREAFGHLQLVGPPAIRREPRLRQLRRMDIRCLDHERIAFPMSDRIAEPGADL